MSFFALSARAADETSLYAPLLALCRSAAFQRARDCSFHHSIPRHRSGTAFPANAYPTVQEWEHVRSLEAQTLCRFRGIYHGIEIPTGLDRKISVHYLSLSRLSLF